MYIYIVYIIYRERNNYINIYKIYIYIYIYIDKYIFIYNNKKIYIRFILRFIIFSKTL